MHRKAEGGDEVDTVLTTKKYLAASCDRTELTDSENAPGRERGDDQMAPGVPADLVRTQVGSLLQPTRWRERTRASSAQSPSHAT